MAATVEARRLTEAHRIAQARLGAVTVRQMFALWPLLDLADLDGSVERWLLATTPVVQAQHATSAGLAATYITTYRTLELGVAEAAFLPVADTVIDAAVLARSLVITGPVHLKAALSRGVQLAQAAETAQATSARAGMRHALSGGRNTVMDSVHADRKALGWSRATSGKPCAFCAALASRGPAYKSHATADFQAHDGCSCTAEPVYRADADWPPGARDYQELWKATTADFSGADKLSAFRRAFEAA